MDLKNTIVTCVRLVDGREILLPISGADKPDVPPVLIKKWQKTVDLLATVFEVPTGLITNIQKETLSIFVASATDDNPFKSGDSLPLGIGMYCETTTGTQDTVHVPHAQKDDLWRDNPSIEFNQVAYLGMPLIWPDGEVFGTFCMLDTKEHYHSDTNIELLSHFKSIIETDLTMLLEKEELKRLNMEKALILREAHHRIKNHLNMILGIIQLNSDNCTATPQAMQEFIDKISDRLVSVAHLHNQLANTDECKLSLGDYLEGIAQITLRSVAGREVAMKISTDPLEVCRETILDTGLLVSELITNSLKHAFQDTDAPEIRITIKSDNDGGFSLDYKDNGIGLPEAFDMKSDEKNIGMMLIQSIPPKMGGSFELGSGQGFHFRMNV